MRALVTTLLLSFVHLAASAQEVKPVIIGQKPLSTLQNKPITIQLTDLTVKETPVETDDGEDNGNNGGDGGDNGGNGGGNGGTGGDNGGTGGDNSGNGGDNDSNGGDNGGNGGSDNDNDSGGGNDNDGGGNSGGGGAGNDDKDDKDNKDDKDDDDKDEKDEKDDKDDKDEKDDKDDKDGKDDKDDKDEKDEKDNKDEKDEKDDKDDKGDDNDNKDNKGDKGDKDEKNDKGKDRTATTFPVGYTLEVLDGEHYSVTGNVVLPAQDFTGVLTVPVRVRNAKHTSPKFELKITVTAAPVINQPPVITGQSPVSTSADTPVQIKLADLKVTDPDNKYPQGFTLTVQPGQHYGVSGSTVTPSAGFTGILTVPVIVNDGKNNSAVFDFKITVTPSSVANATPVITGQLPLSISMNQSVTILLSQLLVTDPDNQYPEDFTLKVFPANNYSLDASTVVPRENFTGDLSVPVTVSDGLNESKPFSLTITITPGANQAPVITGQVGLKIPQGESLEIKLAHLVVEDSDSRYPNDFTLTVTPGENYTITNKTVTPAPGFLGALTVPVSVHDGKSHSEPFNLKVEVISPHNLEITGQRSIEIPEDSSFIVSVDDLMVNDPSNGYPEGFTVVAASGAHYEVANNTITPEPNYSGNLTVPVTVRKGPVSSSSFLLLIVVTPVNDAPELLHVPVDPVIVNGGAPLPVFAGTEVIDVDDDHLLFAEIGFGEGNFIPGKDVLAYETQSTMRLVFDNESGVLFVVGRGSLDEYEELIHSVTYRFEGSPDSLGSTERRIYIELNDGKSTSVTYERVLMFNNDIPLDIPSAFTPNNDSANDRWVITPMQQSDQMNAIVRVYDKSGILVFESPDLEQAWDGHYNGSPLPADVYFYTIEMDLSYRKVSYKGIVSILR